MPRLRINAVFLAGVTVGACGGESGGDTITATTFPTTTASTTAASTSSGSSGASTSSGSSTAAATDFGSTGAGSTTGAVMPECSINADCELAESCCACEGVAVGGTAMPCNVPECKAGVCTDFGVTLAECRLGHCRPARVSCKQAKVACAEEPPKCTLGYLPEVDNLGCPTLRCVPSYLCDVVPDCTQCGTDEMCVRDESGAEPVIRCEPVPVDCQGVPSCDCVGGACPFGTMCEIVRGTVQCSAP